MPAHTQPQQYRPPMGFFLHDLTKSIRRRHRQVRLLSILSFLSAFFLLGMFLFQVNSENYLFAANQVTYGDWCIAELGSGDSEASFLSHSYFNQVGMMKSGITLYDENGKEYRAKAGFMDETLLSIGSISLYEGHFPESDAEIVMTSEMLAELGYSLELGQDITFYSVSDELTADGNITYVTHTFTLVGILQNSGSYWVTGEWMPDALVTESALSEITSAGEEGMTGWFYQLKEEFQEVDTTELYKNLLNQISAADTDSAITYAADTTDTSDAADASYAADVSDASDASDTSDSSDTFETYASSGNATLYLNDSLYSDTASDSSIYYLLMKLLISAAAATALSFLLISYIQKRRPEYYRYRTIGMSRKKVYALMWLEGLFACVPALLAGLVLAAIAGKAFVTIICATGTIRFSYEITGGLVLSALLIWCAAFGFAMLIAMLLTSDRNLQGKSRPLILSDRTKKHLNQLCPRHVLLSMNLRNRRVHRGTVTLAAILGMLFLGLFLFGGIRILEDYESYHLLSTYMNDFDVSCAGDSWTASNENNDSNSRINGKYLDLSIGFSEDFLTELDGISQITSTFSTRDTTHLFEWDGLWDSDEISSYLAWEYSYTSNGITEENYCLQDAADAGYLLEVMGETLWFVSDTQGIYDIMSASEEGTCLHVSDERRMSIMNEVHDICINLIGNNSSNGINATDESNSSTNEHSSETDTDGTIYNYEKFESGEQVFLILPEVYESVQVGDTIRIYTQNIDSEQSTDIEQDDTAVTEAVSENDTNNDTPLDSYIEVTVAGIIINNDDSIDLLFPISTLSASNFHSGIGLVGSESLGRTLATMDGTEYTYNYLNVDVNPYASYTLNIKECAQLFADSKWDNISYQNNYETLQQEWQEFLRTLGIYGVFLIFLAAFYLMLKLDMIQTEINRQSDRIRQLRRMGMERKQLRRLYTLDGLLESRMLWIAPIAVWILRYILILNYVIVDNYQSLWKIYLLLAIGSTLGMLLLHCGARYYMIRKHTELI